MEALEACRVGAAEGLLEERIRGVAVSEVIAEKKSQALQAADHVIKLHCAWQRLQRLTQMACSTPSTRNSDERSFTFGARLSSGFGNCLQELLKELAPSSSEEGADAGTLDAEARNV